MLSETKLHLSEGDSLNKHDFEEAVSTGRFAEILSLCLITSPHTSLSCTPPGLLSSTASFPSAPLQTTSTLHYSAPPVLTPSNSLSSVIDQPLCSSAGLGDPGMRTPFSSSLMSETHNPHLRATFRTPMRLSEKRRHVLLEMFSRVSLQEIAGEGKRVRGEVGVKEVSFEPRKRKRKENNQAMRYKKTNWLEGRNLDGHTHFLDLTYLLAVAL